jgi:hypothetical protein
MIGAGHIGRASFVFALHTSCNHLTLGLPNMRHVGIIIGLFVLAIILMAVATYMDIKQTNRMPAMTGPSKESYWSGGIFFLGLSGFLLLYSHIKSESK